MTIKEFFLKKDSVLKLPITPVSGRDSFRAGLYKIFDVFLVEIDALDLTGITPILHPAEKIRVRNLVDGIKTAINVYFDGYPFEAYQELKNSFDLNSISTCFQKGNYPFSTDFYRLRRNEDNFSLSREEMFHIPFDKRDKIETQRYSIPGFPSLYVADSVYVAWEEMRRPSLNKLQAMRLQSLVPIKFLDVTTDIYMGQDAVITAKTEDELWTHLITWPLIAACSVKVINTDAKFRPEYIVPQLLLQIVRKDGNEQGIRFSSTHINRNKIDNRGSFCNLVIPPSKDDTDNGHCNVLKGMFTMTEPIPWEMTESFTRLHGTFHGAGTSIKSNVDMIQLIEGRPIAYQYTTYGYLEQILHYMTLQPII